MKILLDTHVIQWLHTKPTRLGTKTRYAIQAANSVFYSPLSFFEWIQKDDVTGGRARLLIEATKDVGFQQLPLTTEAVLEASRFGSLRGRDPLDLLLLSQASAGRLRFFTADQTLLGLGFDFVKNAES